MPNLFLDTQIDQSTEPLGTVVKVGEVEESEVKLVRGNLGDSFLDPKLKARELTSQINWVITHRKVDYLGALLSLQTHSSVAVRRKVAAGLSLLAQKEHLPELRLWQDKEADRATWLSLEAAIDKIGRGVGNESIQVRVYSVSEALALVKQILGDQTYTVEGELSEVNLNRQMYFFAVKDKAETRLDCWMFSGVANSLGFPLNDGLQVQITGKFKLSKYSKLYFEVTHIRLTGEGELLRNLKLLEQQLTMEGLFDQSRKRPIPRLPQRILLLASSHSAAISDFIKVLASRRGGIEIFHLPIKTQGIGAEQELLEALQRANRETGVHHIDTIVITRGGGSKDDLVLFNSERVVRAIHGLNRPTIVAIGHERDFTLSEKVADQRASTPSNAAQLVSLSREEVAGLLSAQLGGIVLQCQQKINSYQIVTTKLWQLCLTPVQKQVTQAKLATERTSQIIRQLIFQNRLQTNRLMDEIKSSLWAKLNDMKYELKSLVELDKLVQTQLEWSYLETNKILADICSRVRDTTQEYRRQFDLVVAKLENQDPQNILAKGYAVVSQVGQIVDSVKKFDPQTPVKVQWLDGEVDLGQNLGSRPCI
jgi:exodeoxyribonuclease VII large subunit